MASFDFTLQQPVTTVAERAAVPKDKQIGGHWFRRNIARRRVYKMTLWSNGLGGGYEKSVCVQDSGVPALTELEPKQSADGIFRSRPDEWTRRTL